MALGGGTFTSMNKKLPGTYINFVSVARASASLSDRGVAAMPVEVNWGVDGEVMTVTRSDFQRNTMELFGYRYADDAVKELRELFLHTEKAYLYRLNSGEKAKNTYATAKCSGTRGNDLKIVIAENVDAPEKFDVTLYMGTTKLNAQTVASAKDLVDDNWVTYDKTASLAATAGIALAGGTNGTVSGDSHAEFIKAIESYTFNVLGVETTEEAIKKTYVAFIKRLREEVGLKAQLVLHDMKADYEGVISIKNTTAEGDAKLVYWVTGAEAECAVNASLSNTEYDGEYTVNAGYTQSELETCIDEGYLAFHKVDDEIKVLSDINSLTTETEEKNADFKSNQTVRVCDQIANDVASIFGSKYAGKIPNDAAGRTSLWSDIVKIHTELQNRRAIEEFSDSDITVTKGDTKRSVIVTDTVTPVNAMEQLYMTVYIN